MIAAILALLGFREELPIDTVTASVRDLREPQVVHCKGRTRIVDPGVMDPLAWTDEYVVECLRAAGAL